MNKKVNIQGILYDYITFFFHDNMKILKLKSCEDGKFYYYKITSLTDKVKGVFVDESNFIEKENNEIYSASKINDETINGIRNKLPNESIENYFKYLDNFYRN